MIRKLLSSAATPTQVNFALLIIRLGMGVMMLTHGYPKLLTLLSGGYQNFLDPIGLGPFLSSLATVFAEFLCSILLIAGLFTRIAAFFLGFTMFVAAFILHFDDPIGQKEKALLFFTCYLALWIVGGGRYSLDQKFFDK